MCLQAFQHTSAHVACGAAMLTSSLSFLIQAVMRTRGCLSNRRRRCSMQWTTCAGSSSRAEIGSRTAVVRRLLLCLLSAAAAYSVKLLLYREGSNQFGHSSCCAAVFGQRELAGSYPIASAARKLLELLLRRPVCWRSRLVHLSIFLYPQHREEDQVLRHFRLF